MKEREVRERERERYRERRTNIEISADVARLQGVHDVTPVLAGAVVVSHALRGKVIVQQGDVVLVVFEFIGLVVVYITVCFYCGGWVYI